MVEFIQSEFKKIILKCCKKYERDVVLVLGLDEQGQNTYTILDYDYDYENNQFKGFIWSNQIGLTINQVLGVKIDFLGYSILAEPFIQKAVLRFSQKHKVPYDRVSIFCFPTMSEIVREDGSFVYDLNGNAKMESSVDIFLYDGRTSEGSRYLETITFSDLFKEEDMVLPT